MNINHTFKRLCAVAIAVLVLALTSKGQSSLNDDFSKSGLIGKWRVTYSDTYWSIKAAGVYDINAAKFVSIKYDKGETATGALKRVAEGVYEVSLPVPRFKGEKSIVGFSIVGDVLQVTHDHGPKPGRGVRIKP